LFQSRRNPDGKSELLILILSSDLPAAEGWDFDPTHNHCVVVISGKRVAKEDLRERWRWTIQPLSGDRERPIVLREGWVKAKPGEFVTVREIAGLAGD
jgi:hypothetical protein